MKLWLIAAHQHETTTMAQQSQIPYTNSSRTLRLQHKFSQQSSWRLLQSHYFNWFASKYNIPGPQKTLRTEQHLCSNYVYCQSWMLKQKLIKSSGYFPVSQQDPVILLPSSTLLIIVFRRDQNLKVSQQ